jgi:hypothetical protein
MTLPDAFSLVIALLLPVIVIAGFRLACFTSGWLALAQAAPRHLASVDESRWFCTVGLTGGRVFVYFRSFTVVRRLGSVVELRLVFTPSWLGPPQCVSTPRHVQSWISSGISLCANRRVACSCVPWEAPVVCLSGLSLSSNEIPGG